MHLTVGFEARLFELDGLEDLPEGSSAFRYTTLTSARTARAFAVQVSGTRVLTRQTLLVDTSARPSALRILRPPRRTPSGAVVPILSDFAVLPLMTSWPDTRCRAVENRRSMLCRLPQRS